MHHHFGAGRIGVDPLAFHVRDVDFRVAQHAVPRMHTALAVEMDGDLAACDDFLGHGGSGLGSSLRKAGNLPLRKPLAKLGPDDSGPALHFGHGLPVGEEGTDRHQLPALAFIAELNPANLCPRQLAAEKH